MVRAFGSFPHRRRKEPKGATRIGQVKTTPLSRAPISPSPVSPLPTPQARQCPCNLSGFWLRRILTSVPEESE